MHDPQTETAIVPIMKTLIPGRGWVEAADVKTYQSQCACGWKGPTRTIKREAEEDGTLHTSRVDD